MDNLPAPPAPPPLQPSTPTHNPYDFITNPPNRAKKGKFNFGGNKQTRLILSVLGGLILLVIIALLYGLFAGSGSSQKQEYISALQQQTEIIRISDIGVSKSKSASTKNKSLTTKLTLESQQNSLNKIASRSGVKITPKLLALGKDTQIDTSLASATQANQFDETFNKLLDAKLQKYQQLLKNLYDSSTKQDVKKQLSDYYQSVDLLIKR